MYFIAYVCTFKTDILHLHGQKSWYLHHIFCFINIIQYQKHPVRKNKGTDIWSTFTLNYIT